MPTHAPIPSTPASGQDDSCPRCRGPLTEPADQQFTQLGVSTFVPSKVPSTCRPPSSCSNLSRSSSLWPPASSLLQDGLLLPAPSDPPPPDAGVEGIWKDVKGKGWYVQAYREHAPKWMGQKS